MTLYESVDLLTWHMWLLPSRCMRGKDTDKLPAFGNMLGFIFLGFWCYTVLSGGKGGPGHKSLLVASYDILEATQRNLFLLGSHGAR